MFFTKGEGAPLFEWHFIALYREGIWNAAFMALRILSLIVGSSIFMSYATTTIELTDSLEGLLSPLKKIHVPVHEFAMMMSIALRFIPTLAEETDRIMSAQKARGADFSTDPSLVESCRSPLCTNIVADGGGMPQKRLGWRKLWQKDKPVYGLFAGRFDGTEKKLAHIGTAHYAWDDETAPTEIRTGLPERRSRAA